MSNYYEQARYYSNQRDMLIHQLQGEVMDMRSRGKNYNQLRDQMVDLENQYRHLLEAKAIQEDQLKHKIDSGFKDSQYCLQEIDELRTQIQQKSKQNSEFASEIHRLKQVNEHRDDDLYSVELDIKAKYETQQGLKQEYEGVVYDISKLKEERAKLAHEVQFLQQDIKQAADKAQQIQSRAEEGAAQGRQQQEQIKALERGIGEREREIQRKEDALFSTNAEIQRSKDQCEDLRRREQTIEAQFQDKELANREHDRILAQEQSKLTMQRKEIDLTDQDTHRLSTQLQLQLKDNDLVSVALAQINENNSLLRQEQQALVAHARTLEDQNRALVSELEKFSLADEALRGGLDRRGRVREIKEQMQGELLKSQHKVRINSPDRNLRQQLQ